MNGNFNVPKADVLLRRFCRIAKRLVDERRTDMALEYVLLSLHFVARVCPQSLGVWHSEFPGLRYLESTLTPYHEDVFSALLAAIYATAKYHPQDASAISVLVDVATWLKVANNSNLTRQFVRLLAIGNPSTFFLVTQSSPLNMSCSFIWLCINLSVPLRHIIHPELIHILARRYVEISEKDINNALNIHVLRDICDGYLESFNESESNELHFQESAFIIRLFSRVVSRSPTGMFYACFTLHFLSICIYYIYI